MRGECEFRSCPCSNFLGKRRCRHCGHGQCWHKLSKQFNSPRLSARTPVYLKIPIVPAIFIPEVPPISPFESSDSDYCQDEDQLPV